MSQPDPSAGRTLTRRLRLFVIVFGVCAILVAGYGLISRAAANSKLHDLTDARAVPIVAIVTPTRVLNQSGLELPGRLQAFIRAPIYARVPGYLKTWKHDIGAKVKAGDVLAEIDTPDLDQQLLQARGDLSVAEANAKLAQITAQRWQALAGTDAVAKQDVDQRTFTLNANLAQVKSAQANVDRLVAESGFKRLIAPFDGVATGGAELFVVSATGKLRVYVNVPQNDVPSVPPGTAAKIRVPEHPDKTYNGTVEASAQSVDPTTGTTLMQIIVDNSAGELMPGDYASISLAVAATANVLSVPSSALIFDAKGLSIATVDARNHVVIKPVKIGRDLGAVIELASGLSPDDRVIQNPPDGIATGAEVRLAASGASDGGGAKNKNERG